MRYFQSRGPLFWILTGAALVLFLGGAGGAALCKYTNLDCGIAREAEPENLEDFVTPDRSQTKLPAGFRQEVVAKGLEFPVDFDFLPDGRIIVAQQDGLFRLVENGRLVPRPVLDIREQVGRSFFRGVVGVDVDSDFAKNGFFYTAYAQRLGKGSEPTTGLVSRFRMRAGVAGEERVLLGADGDTPCLELPAGADCLPVYGDHLGADMVFLDDGTMLISVGEGGGQDTNEDLPIALVAQKLDYLGGKVLRITRSGKGVPDNPFWNGSENANRSKVWALGMRNPFRLASGREGTVYVGDVGHLHSEEISRVSRGVNLGWPCFEGTSRTEGYRDTDLCRDLYRSPPASLQGPLIELKHPDALSLTLGDLSTGLAFPKRFANVLFFGDWGRSWLRYAKVNGDGTLGPVMPFARDTGGPVAIKAGSDGALYYLALNAGELRRIRFG